MPKHEQGHKMTVRGDGCKNCGCTLLPREDRGVCASCTSLIERAWDRLTLSGHRVVAA